MVCDLEREGGLGLLPWVRSHLTPWAAAAGGMDGNLKIWDLANYTCRHVCQHEGGIVRLKWHDWLPLVYTACTDGVVRLWDARSGQCLYQLTGHQVSLVCMSRWPARWRVDSSSDLLIACPYGHSGHGARPGGVLSACSGGRRCRADRRRRRQGEGFLGLSGVV